MASTVETGLKHESSLLIFFLPFGEIIKKHNYLQFGNFLGTFRLPFCSVKFKYFPQKERILLRFFVVKISIHLPVLLSEYISREVSPSLPRPPAHFVL